MRLKYPVLILFTTFILFSFFSLDNATGQTFNMPQGKVITGLDKDAALEEFGEPARAGENLWYYSAGGFFIYFPSGKALSIYLYPQSCEVNAGVPLEVKVFAALSNSKTIDITSESELLISEPAYFNTSTGKKGIVIPSKEGEYEISAKYKGILSNPCYLSVKSAGKRAKEDEQLLNISVLPYKPVVPPSSRMDFVALGTFFRQSEGRYEVREVSDQSIWLSVRGSQIINEYSRTITFPQAGTINVFARHKKLESNSQEARVEQDYLLSAPKLKHIAVLPEFAIIPLGSVISIRAFGTYSNNKVEELTKKINWVEQDYDVLSDQGEGNFLAKSKGISEITAESDGVLSLAAKVIVVSPEAVSTNMLYQDGKDKEKASFDEAVNDIRKDIKEIKKNLIGLERELSHIKVMPGSLEIALGEQGQVKAYAVYSDNSQDDVTLLSQWESSDNKVVSVNKGKITTLSKGESQIYARFKEKESARAFITVTGPKLISIIVSPAENKLSMDDKISLKAEGVFSDASSKDITREASWIIDNRRIAKINKGIVTPVMIGSASVYAQYLSVKSLPVNIRVIFTFAWLWKIVSRVILCLAMILAAVLSILYFKMRREAKRILSFYADPRRFIISLYENMKAFLTAAGIKHESHMAPLFYAEAVKDKYSIDNSLFLKLTVKFEESKYSGHTLGPQESALALDHYNDFLRVVFSSYNKLYLTVIKCIMLFNRKPILIPRNKNQAL